MLHPSSVSPPWSGDKLEAFAAAFEEVCKDLLGCDEWTEENGGGATRLGGLGQKRRAYHRLGPAVPYPTRFPRPPWRGHRPPSRAVLDDVRRGLDALERGASGGSFEAVIVTYPLAGWDAWVESEESCLIRECTFVLVSRFAARFADGESVEDAEMWTALQEEGRAPPGPLRVRIVSDALRRLARIRQKMADRPADPLEVDVRVDGKREIVTIAGCEVPIEERRPPLSLSRREGKALLIYADGRTPKVPLKGDQRARLASAVEAAVGRAGGHVEFTGTRFTPALKPTGAARARAASLK